MVVIARDWLGLYEVEGGSKVEGRIQACMVHAPEAPAFCLASLYLEHSVGLNEHNSGMLAKLGEFLSGLECEFVVAGDFNFNPEVLHSSRFVGALGGSLGLH